MRTGVKIVFALALMALSAAAQAATLPLSVDLFGATFIVPLQKVSATQLYCFRNRQGYPAVETVLVSKGNFQLTAGAAAVLGESKNVPFVGVQTRLSDKFFDTTNNALLFGVWVGKDPKRRGVTGGLKATVPLW